jgi:hypothetical protein
VKIQVKDLIKISRKTGQYFIQEGLLLAKANFTLAKNQSS